jgi:hypothetical protein
MFESILRHKEVVIAAIAITALAGYVVPLNQFAAATSIGELLDPNGGDDTPTTTADDTINQEGTATSNPTQSSTIEAPNTQTNAIVTGDANAEQTNTATSEANAASAAFGGSGGDAWSSRGDKCTDDCHSDKCDDDCHPDKCEKCPPTKVIGGDGGDASSTANAASSAEVSGNINVADTSADNNVQTNTNTQEFDVDQEQESEAEVENDAFQINDNYFNLDLFDD